jgi:mono/diheme cytochrome c family protein
MRTSIVGLLVGVVGAAACARAGELERRQFAEVTSLPNSHPIANVNGFAATYSTAGFVDLVGPYFTPQGTNGRSCGSCHSIEDGWTASAATMQQRFADTGGLDPVFNLLDADRPDAFPSNEALRNATVEQRRAAFSMLLQAKFTRRISVPANAEFEVTGVQDPFGVGTTSVFWFFRRAMPTANFRNHIVSWDGANTVLLDRHAGLARQARGNITGAQQATAPADEGIVEEIVDYEEALSHAQLIYTGVGYLDRLDENGGRGGPRNFSLQSFLGGRFDLYDAWIGDSNAKRAQIARGQELFNNGKSGQPRCGGCHSAANDGQSATGALQDSGASRPEFAAPDMAVYTLRNKLTGAVMQTTDGGRGWRTGRWADLNRFKAPSLRGISSRGAYFHNGIARSLTDVVRHYERALGFSFTDAEREDLVAFLGAL